MICDIEAAELRRRMEQEQSCSEQGIGHANEKQREVLILPSTKSSEMAQEKEEDAAVEEGSESGVELSSTLKEVYEMLKWAMKSTCQAFDDPLQGLFNQLEQLLEHPLKMCKICSSVREIIPTRKWSTQMGSIIGFLNRMRFSVERVFSQWWIRERLSPFSSQCYRSGLGRSFWWVGCTMIWRMHVF